MRVITALAAPILLALILTSPLFPVPRSADHPGAPGPVTGGRLFGAPEPTAPYAVEKFGGSSNTAAGAPTLDEGLGNAQQAGVATYCAENPPYCIGWSDPDAFLGAVQSFSYGDQPYDVTVCRHEGSPCVGVTVVSFCACGDRQGKPTVIDLSPSAFRAINDGSLAAGVIDVVVTVNGGPALPPTDTEPEP